VFVVQEICGLLFLFFFFFHSFRTFDPRNSQVSLALDRDHVLTPHVRFVSFYLFAWELRLHVLCEVFCCCVATPLSFPRHKARREQTGLSFSGTKQTAFF